MLAIYVASSAYATPNLQMEKPTLSENLAVSAAPEALEQFRQFCPQGTPVLFLNEYDPQQQYFQVACRQGQMVKPPMALVWGWADSTPDTDNLAADHRCRVLALRAAVEVMWCFR